MHWTIPLLVAAGSGVGGVLRLFTHEVARHWLPARPELGTLAINLAGCLVVGAVLAVLEPRGLFRPGLNAWKALLVIGILGGYTTFSAFSLDTLMLLREGLWGRATAYVLVSTVGGIVAAGLAFALVRQLVPAPIPLD